MKVPYHLVKASTDEERYAFMQTAITRTPRIPRLAPIPVNPSPAHRLIVACYGPSLADTWPIIRDQHAAGHRLLSMSGATHFLASRGIIPDYHVDMDPRAHKLRHLDPPIDGVEYLMASCCPPSTWDRLAGHSIRLWHARQNADTVDWVQQHDPGGVVLWTGSTVGLGGLHIGGSLGYCHFEIHGMDSSFAADDPTARHAGPHYGPSQEKHRCTWDAGRVTYHTTRIMANACAEALNMLSGFPVFAVFHGQGLLQALVREAGLDSACAADETAKVERLRRSGPIFITLPTPPHAPAPHSCWDALIDQLPKDAVPELTRFARQAERLRPAATYNTGTVPLETALQLRALCHFYRPAVIAEVGTFIGTSTYALHASRTLYTCDASNDCLVPTDNIIPHPFTTSTLLFKTLLLRGFANHIDLFFFDGRLPADDLPLILALSHANTVYAFDDCSTQPGADKGLANLALLRDHLPQHVYLPPTPTFAGRSTLGALLPIRMATAADASAATIAA